MIETLAILSLITFGLGLLFWLSVPWFDPLLTMVVEFKLEFTDIFHPYLVELHNAGFIRRKHVERFIEYYFLTALLHALIYCLFMLLLPVSGPALVIYLLTKRALKNKIRD